VYGERQVKPSLHERSFHRTSLIISWYSFSLVVPLASLYHFFLSLLPENKSRVALKESHIELAKLQKGLCLIPAISFFFFSCFNRDTCHPFSALDDCKAAAEFQAKQLKAALNAETEAKSKGLNLCLLFCSPPSFCDAFFFSVEAQLKAIQTEVEQLRKQYDEGPSRFRFSELCALLHHFPFSFSFCAFSQSSICREGGRGCSEVCRIAKGPSRFGSERRRACSGFVLMFCCCHLQT
jgi:hypothetical protein